MYEGKRIRIKPTPPKAPTRREPPQQDGNPTLPAPVQEKALQLITHGELERDIADGSLVDVVIAHETIEETPHAHP